MSVRDDLRHGQEAKQRRSGLPPATAEWSHDRLEIGLGTTQTAALKNRGIIVFCLFFLNESMLLKKTRSRRSVP